ncbi:outer membrane protein assembly factor BamB family protein [Parabacteroides pacaensis]|uniref:outer membrane protein assembly factor BamB family protein n=1 Tax=Parabacteroides pacaensis TaxID=2086575 RepID=UPI000D10DFD5|nr:PQQ-binding-like beta-propeller repeat protein [Parabacteroides pacaensis]
MRKTVVLFLFCFVLYGLQAADFRFALLTDIHITKNATSGEDLQNSVNQINATKDIAFVLVTGDITEEGDRESLAKAKSILDRLKMKYYIIPGNHDTKWSESGATYFSHLFGDERFKFEYEGYLFLGFNTGPLLRMADGHVSPQDITWIKEQLKTAGKQKPVFLVTHYPLQNGDVDNWYDLTDAVRPYNIRAFLGGHYHSNRYLAYDGIPGILNRSNLRGNEEVGGYSVYKITSDSILVYEHKIGGEMTQWASLSTRKKYYDPETKIDARPDFVINKEYEKVKEKWMVQTGVGIYASPVVYKNKVYVGDGIGKMSCYDLQDGTKKWTFQSGNRIIGTAAVAKGIVVFGSADKYIYGLNAENGTLLWKVEASEPVLGAVTIDKNIAYIGASDHTLRVINIRNGEVCWTYQGVKGYIETRPLVTKDKIIFGAWDNTLYALNKKDGDLLWKWTGDLTRMHFSPAAVWPVAVDKKVFIVDPQRAMTAIHMENGETIWRTYQAKVRETIGLSRDKRRVYAKTMMDSVVCFVTQGEKPVELWRSNVGFGYEFAPSMIEEKENVVFGSTKNGLIFALDAYSGQVLWKHQIGTSLINTVYPLSRHKVLFTAASGEVGLLEWNEK